MSKTWADFPCKDVVYGLIRKDRGYTTKTQVLIYIFPQRKRLRRSLVDKAVFQQVFRIEIPDMEIQVLKYFRIKSEDVFKTNGICVQIISHSMVGCNDEECFQYILWEIDYHW